MNTSTYKFLLLVFLAWASVTFACKQAGKAETSGTPSTQLDESQRILDKETFAKEIKKSGSILVDVRTPQEFEQSHIENAININFFDPEFKYKLLDLDRDKRYYLYCKNETRSYRSMKFMEDNDFKHVFMLKGGYQDWNTAKAEDEEKK